MSYKPVHDLFQPDYDSQVMSEFLIKTYGYIIISDKFSSVYTQSQTLSITVPAFEHKNRIT